MAQSGGVDFKLDRKTDVALGTQLAWKLRAAIASGSLEPGDRLPGVRELAAEAGVNVNTVRAVYARLAEQGTIVSQHGRGTFVGDAPGDEGELRALAERTALEAARSGVDPRELAAMLFSAGGAPAAGEPSPPAATPRAELRREISALERQLAELDQELSVLDEPPPPAPQPAPRTRRARGARVVSAGELEAIRDSLSMQVAERRVQLELARERHRLADRQPAPDARATPRSVATRPPETVVGGGTWTLRWRA